MGASSGDAGGPDPRPGSTEGGYGALATITARVISICRPRVSREVPPVIVAAHIRHAVERSLMRSKVSS